MNWRILLISIPLLTLGCVSGSKDSPDQDMAVEGGVPDQAVRDLAVKDISVTDGAPGDSLISLPTYKITEGAADCKDIRNWASRWLPGLDTSQTIPAGFAFSYFGIKTEASILVGPHLPDQSLTGAMQLQGSDWYMYRSFNLKGAVLSPYRREIFFNGLSHIYQAMDGAVLITKWDSVIVKGPAVYTSVSFEVHLLPSGVIEFHYCEGFDSVDKDNTVTAKIGIQSDEGKTLIIAVDGHAALAGKSFVFTPQ